MCFLVTDNTPRSFLPARRNASATARVLAMTLCPSVSVAVCLSQVGVLSKWMDRSSWFLACRLLSTYHTLCCKEVQVSTKIKALPSWTSSQNLDFVKNLLRCIARRNVFSVQFDKLDRRRSAKLTVPPSSDARPLVCHRRSSSSVCSTIQSCGSISDNWYLFR